MGREHIRKHRNPKEAQECIACLEKHLTTVGFLGHGGGVYLRSVREEVEFNTQARAQHLQVVPVSYWSEDTIYYPILDRAKPIDTVVIERGNAAFPLVKACFADLRRAHNVGLVYGDRWPNNILVSDNRVWNIDFDVAYEGPYTRELEVAEAIYYIASRSQGKLTEERLLQLIGQPWFELQMMQTFLSGHHIIQAD